jgi:gliding motility-associated-like protein
VECDPLTVYIPNTFTPDNDGLNDIWEPVLSPECWSEVEVKIYNRWGDLIWESYDPYNLQWNGGSNGGLHYVPNGVYVWTFKGRKLNSSQIEDLEGRVTIFR